MLSSGITLTVNTLEERDVLVFGYVVLYHINVWFRNRHVEEKGTIKRE